MNSIISPIFSSLIIILNIINDMKVLRVSIPFNCFESSPRDEVAIRIKR
ncbi:hypothetical protein FOMG_17639 [Fusarium oxysporum f. sp. melonis 26406]|uniref:Uncharacterized protein n=1 Tax=Fusarium oxysporum f. sp. melonis 26406 TaxID=1089452 RepID=W9Z2U1_FUSOX|nr:hypothetical protein FOMG_17639 [Fusarium oxysporum f. sp. melonis 26406]